MTSGSMESKVLSGLNSDLLSKGYNYSGWAKGVAEAEGMTWSSLPKGETTGRAAVMFMKDSLGQTFSEQKLNRISFRRRLKAV